MGGFNLIFGEGDSITNSIEDLFFTEQYRARGADMKSAIVFFKGILKVHLKESSWVPFGV